MSTNNTKPRIILASKSPRRLEILRLAGFDPAVLPADADETSIAFEAGSPEKYVRDIAALKLNASLGMIGRRNIDASGAIVIAADTVVYLPDLGTPIGKPRDFDDACRMLRALSGKTHRVVSGVALSSPFSGRSASFEESTDVTFRQLSSAEIEDYVRSSSPYDKAGAYGIQEAACSFVSRIVGDYYNVVGLPICRVVVEIDGMIK